MKKLWYIVGAILLLVGLFEARAYAQNQTGVLTRLVSSTLRFSDGTFGLKVAVSGSDGTLQSIGGGTQYAEDDAHASGNTGTLALAVRNDAGTALAADGDNSILQVDNTGALRVTGGGGGTQYAEDDAHASGNTGTLALGVRRDAAASSTATDGDNATFNFDSTGRLWTNTELLDVAALADNTANPTVTGLAAYLMCYDGATWDRCAVSTDVTEDAPETAGGTGPMVMSIRRDAPASSAGTSGDNSTFNTDENGALYMTPIATNAGGATTYTKLSAGATEDEHEICTAACTLYSILVTNTNAAVRYLKCENDTAANTAPGTDTPEFRIAVPGATTGAGASHSFPVGAAFSAGLTCWMVTGVADADVAEVAANELIAFYTFKQ
jgi:hypothetical protein